MKLLQLWAARSELLPESEAALQDEIARRGLTQQFARARDTRLDDSELDSKSSHTLRNVILVLVLLSGAFTLDYFLIHPGSRERQAQIVTELKATPLPPFSTEESFEAGYQPAKGSAGRKFISGQTERQTFDFYKNLMNERGWQPIEQRSPEVIAFWRENVIFTVALLRDDLSRPHFAITYSWPGSR